VINIEENISLLNKKIEKKTSIIAVSKKKSAELVEQAYLLGIKNFGENYLQEALQKIIYLNHLDINWHFIGKIQSNKCKDIARNFQWVHTIDRFKIAKRLNDACPLDKIINVLIQINIDNEESKSGINESQLFDLAEKISVLPNLKLKGIMVIPKNNLENNLTEESFKKTLEISTKLRNKFSEANEISMGMSNDFELAIKNGSTMVRIGTGIFGERN
jgi:pyridoxal phosphate enzyme (YggS family)